MESNFRSTVLQRPPGKDDERDRRHPRDILNPAGSVVAPPRPPQGPPRHSAFSLRSPTQTEFPPYPSQSGTSANHHHSPPRPVLNSFMSASVGSGQSLPPPPPPPLHSSSNSAGGHLHAAPPSPMRGSPAYYPPPQKEQHREKGSFYDSITDTMTNERRVSETGSWQGASTPKVSCSRRRLFFLLFFSILYVSGTPIGRLGSNISCNSSCSSLALFHAFSPSEPSKTMSYFCVGCFFPRPYPIQTTVPTRDGAVSLHFPLW